MPNHCRCVTWPCAYSPSRQRGVLVADAHKSDKLRRAVRASCTHAPAREKSLKNWSRSRARFATDFVYSAKSERRSGQSSSQPVHGDTRGRRNPVRLPHARMGRSSLCQTRVPRLGESGDDQGYQRSHPWRPLLPSMTPPSKCPVSRSIPPRHQPLFRRCDFGPQKAPPDRHSLDTAPPPEFKEWVAQHPIRPSVRASTEGCHKTVT